MAKAGAGKNHSVPAQYCYQRLACGSDTAARCPCPLASPLRSVLALPDVRKQSETRAERKCLYLGRERDWGRLKSIRTPGHQIPLHICTRRGLRCAAAAGIYCGRRRRDTAQGPRGLWPFPTAGWNPHSGVRASRKGRDCVRG